jgi:hypothetical protein
MEFFGLPLHPLVVHGVVVLVPLATVGILLSAAVPVLRRHVLGVAMALAIGAAALVPLATVSGEALEDDTAESEELNRHTELGESTLPWVAALALGASAFGAQEFARRRGDGAPAWARSRRVGVAVIVLAVGTSLAATVQVVRVGHSGSASIYAEE